MLEIFMYIFSQMHWKGFKEQRGNKPDLFPPSLISVQIFFVILFLQFFHYNLERVNLGVILSDHPLS